MCRMMGCMSISVTLNAQTVMCLMNTSEKELPVHFAQFPERTAGFSGGQECYHGTTGTAGFYDACAANVDCGIKEVNYTSSCLLKLSKL